MLLGIPIRMPVLVVERQCRKAFEEAEHRTKDGKNGLYEQGHHGTKEPLKFSFVNSPRDAMGAYQRERRKVNNGRLTFIMLLKEDQELHMRQNFKEFKDTTELTKHMGPVDDGNARCPEASDSVEVKRQKEKTQKQCTRMTA